MTDDEREERIELLRADISRVVRAHTDSWPEDVEGIGLEAVGVVFAEQIVRRVWRHAGKLPSLARMMKFWREAGPPMETSFEHALYAMQQELEVGQRGEPPL